MSWAADGERFALTVRHPDHLGLWVGDVEGALQEIEDTSLNGLLGSPVRWMPDQEHLLVRRVPARGAAPAPPPIPAGPKTAEGSGDTPRSTYESRNLLQTAHDDALFTWYATSELVLLEPRKGKQVVLGQPALYSTATPSPDGKYLLVEHLVGPWSHDVGWDRFASELEVWDRKGRPVASLASLPLADEVPIHGVPEGPRKVSWQTSAPHTLFWVEALDWGDPMAEVPHRDRLLRLEAPFDSDPSEVFRAEHRIRSLDWGEGDLLLLTQWERMRRWRYAWLLDLDKGSSRLWFDLSDKDRYADPGRPLYRQLANGRWVMRQEGDALTFEGSGATPEGDRPFLDLRSMSTDKVDRLFRSRADHY